MFGLFMLCCGFFVIPSNIPDWFIWGYWMGFHTYAFELFMFNEFDSVKLNFLNKKRYRKTIIHYLKLLKKS